MTQVLTPLEYLEQLVPQYGINKSELDSYKKICDKESKELKELLINNDLDTFTAGGFTVTKSVQKRESLNEEKLIQILKDSGIDCSKLIKTKEYIDMDALESALYNSEIPEEIVWKMDDCTTVKELTTLRIKASKKEK